MRTLLVALVLALSTVPVLVTDNGNQNTHRHPQKEKLHEPKETSTRANKTGDPKASSRYRKAENRK